MGWPVCRWAWIQQGVNQIDLGDAPGMASSGAIDSEQVIRITLTIVTPILTAGIGIVALVIGDWRERRTRHGRRKLSVEDAGRQVTFAEDWFTASKLIADSPDAQQRAAARAQAWLDEAAELLAESKPPPQAEEAVRHPGGCCPGSLAALTCRCCHRPQSPMHSSRPSTLLSTAMVAPVGLSFTRCFADTA